MSREFDSRHCLMIVLFILAIGCGLWALYMLIDWLIHGRPDRFRLACYLPEYPARLLSVVRVTGSWEFESPLGRVKIIIPDRDAHYLGICREIARRAKCTRRQVGALIVKD